MTTVPAMAADFAVANSDAKNGSLFTPEFQTLRPIYTDAVDDRNPPSRNIAFQNKTVGPVAGATPGTVRTFYRSAE